MENMPCHQHFGGVFLPFAPKHELITGRSKSKGFVLSVSSVSRSKQKQSKSEFVLFSDWMKTCITRALDLIIWLNKCEFFWGGREGERQELKVARSSRAGGTSSSL